MDTEAVRSFVRAAELGQLQHAANELGVTQQAVSKRIATLERELEVRLFTRTARGVELTLDGQAYFSRMRGTSSRESSVPSLRSDQVRGHFESTFSACVARRPLFCTTIGGHIPKSIST